MIRVTVWGENLHEAMRKQANVLAHYPDGMHNCIARFLREEADFQVTVTTQYDEEGNPKDDSGVTQELLDNTDVMIYWSHGGYRRVSDETVQMITDAVRMGMGIIFLHSAHISKPFRALMGTCGRLHWRENGDWERLWVVNPAHPIARGLGEYVRIPHEETYGEPFGIPEPDQLVFIGNYEGGEVFRSGCCWFRDNGKIFYFQPGHETYPIYHMPEIQLILKNAVRWAYSPYRIDSLGCTRATIPSDEE